MAHSIFWRRIDRPGHESARLISAGARWHLDGSGVFLFDGSACALQYAIVCDAQWRTRSVTVRGWSGAEPVELAIECDNGRWSVNSCDAPQAAGCIDIDLGFSPSTNLLPIRRLGLAIGQSGTVTAAWLRFPSLTLEPLDQVYSRIATDVYRYESRGGSFTADLKVNDEGFVTSYPGFFEEVIGHD